MQKLTLFFSILLLSIFTFGQNKNLSNGTIFNGEPYISVNPTNPRHMVVAWMGYVPFKKMLIRTRVTFNGGKTWSEIVDLPHAVSGYTSADPSIAFDNTGNVFVSYVDFTGYQVSPLAGAVYVCRSTDGGLTWANPVEVISTDSDPGKRPIDRPWMKIDHSNTENQGNIYITTMNAKGATIGYHPYLTISKDGGNTFNNWEHLDTINWLSGLFIPQPMPTPCLSANGTFYAAYPSYVFTQSPVSQYIVASSVDGGSSFTYNTIFSPPEVAADSLAKMGYLLISDPANENHLAFFYLDKTYGDLDVFYRESFDKGNTWSDGLRVNDDTIGNNKMQDLVWADFDNDGDLVASWRDRRNSADSGYSTSSEIWAAVRLADSVNFSQNFPLSNEIVAFDSVLNASGNDFMCVKFANDTINAVWGDARTGTLNIWFQRTTINGILLSTRLLSAVNNELAGVFPNPFISTVTIKGHNLKTINIYNQEGKKVITRYNYSNSDNWKINLSALLTGTYILEIISDKGAVIKTVVKK